MRRWLPASDPYRCGGVVEPLLVEVPLDECLFVVVLVVLRLVVWV